MLYGFLGEQFGKVHRYDVASPIEAVKALSVTIKGFKQALIDGGYYRVLLAGKDDLSIDETVFPSSSRETIRIVPVIEGSGDFGKILLGAALIAISIALPGSSAFFASGVGGLIASGIGNLGFSLILGGISGLLFKPPKIESQESPDNQPSFVFAGAVNTTRQGGAVPVCFGRIIVGSQVISVGLSVEQL